MNNFPNQLTARDSRFIFAFLAALFPFIVLAAFNHPSADDFEYALRVMSVGFWKTQTHFYMRWNGRYFATALISMSPLVIRSFLLYKFVPLVLFAGLFHAFYKLVRELTGTYFEKQKALIAALALMTLYLGKMSSVAQGFYWHNGAITYQVPNILTVYLCAYIARMHKVQSGKQRIFSLLLSVALVFAIAGSNETSMVTLLALVYSILVWSLYCKRHVDWRIFTLAVAASVAAYFVVTAPGNSVRLAHELEQRQSLLFAAKLSVSKGLISIFHWITFLPTAALTILFIPAAAQMAEKRIRLQNSFFVHPLFSLAVYAALLAAGFLPGCWTIGGPPPRAVNVIQLFVLLGWFFNVYTGVEYGIRKYKMAPPSLPAYGIVLICFFAFLGFLKEDSNIRTAYLDLLSGKAARYDKELNRRYKLIAESKADKCEVNQIKKTPDTIFFNDITFDANDWKNDGYAKYFNKTAIVLAEPMEVGS